MTEQTAQPIEYTTRKLDRLFEKHNGRGNSAETQDMHFLIHAFSDQCKGWEMQPNPGLHGSRIVELSIFEKGTLVNHYNGSGWDKIQVTKAQQNLIAQIAEAFPAPYKD